MDKKIKQHRHKTLTEEELTEISETAPRGASFDTEEGRAAQGMRPDIGAGESAEERKQDEPRPAKPPPDAANAANEVTDAEEDVT